jgi:hypothetical protein
VYDFNYYIITKMEEKMEKLTCPKCQNEMDFMGFLKSPTPWHLKCAHCKTKLRLDKYELYTFLIAISLGIVAISGLSYFKASPVVYAVVLTAVVAGFEYLIFTMARKFGVGLEER